ncbi:MAG TPA: hypothetical protein DCL03_01825 [Leclercia adecarboxylata]|nr:hypothetical protein [Leclercia adecarboxylata]
MWRHYSNDERYRLAQFRASCFMRAAGAALLTRAQAEGMAHSDLDGAERIAIMILCPTFFSKGE